MLLSNLTDPNGQVSKAESGFEVFPFDSAVRRLAVLFDPTKVDIPCILSTLEPFGLKPRVISVICPMKGVVCKA